MSVRVKLEAIKQFIRLEDALPGQEGLLVMEAQNRGIVEILRKLRQDNEDRVVEDAEQLLSSIFANRTSIDGAAKNSEYDFS